MALSDGGNPEGMSDGRPEGADSADTDDGEDAEMQKRLAAIKIPARSSLPPPPDIQFSRPSFGRKADSSGVPGLGSSSGITSNSVDDSDQADQPSHLGASLVIGVTFPTCVIVGASIGTWIDHRWNSHGTPWGTIIMSLAGIAAGFMNIFRVVSMLDRGKSKKK
jgi:F0F1-type ATP synthase assembly protein I